VRVRVVGRQSMVKVKTGREYAKRYALKCLMAYLDLSSSTDYRITVTHTATGRRKQPVKSAAGSDTIVTPTSSAAG